MLAGYFWHIEDAKGGDVPRMCARDWRYVRRLHRLRISSSGSKSQPSKSISDRHVKGLHSTTSLLSLFSLLSSSISCSAAVTRPSSLAFLSTPCCRQSQNLKLPASNLRLAAFSCIPSRSFNVPVLPLSTRNDSWNTQRARYFSDIFSSGFLFVTAPAALFLIA